MDASIDFSGVLRGSIADGGGGDEVIITPVVTSGTKIADVSVNGDEKDLYCPTPPAPTEVDITPVVTSGTKIADVSIGGVEKDLYTPDYETDIAALDGRLDTAEGNITSLTGRVGTAEGNITSLTGRVGTAEGNITEIKQSLSQLDGLIIYKDLTPTDDYAEFDDGSNLPLISLISTIEPIQSGSGTPSQDNPRPISGHSDIDIIVSPNSDFSGGTTYSINFVDGGNPLTVYGGTLDVISGVLTVDRVNVFLKDLTFTRQARSSSVGGYYFRAKIDDNAISDTDATQLYSHGVSNNPYASKENCARVFESSAYLFVGFSDDMNITTLAEFNTWISNNQNASICYKIKTPLTIQLTPTEVDSLLGQNYINSNTGDITNVKYLGVLNLS